MRKTINIMDVQIDSVNMQEATDRINEFVKSDKVHKVCTPNPEIIMRALKDDALKAFLNESDLVVPDGIGVVIAGKILKTPFKERVAGYDLVQNTMKQAVQNGYKYFFFGGKPGIAEQAAAEMRKKYPGIQIVGTRNGYFKPEENPKIVQEINDSGANIVLVALGAPKQEIWIKENSKALSQARVCIGVGGSLDVMSGTVKRAPLIFQKLYLEWFYRLITDPRRFGRMLVLPQFLIKIIFKRY